MFHKTNKLQNKITRLIAAMKRPKIWVIFGASLVALVLLVISTLFIFQTRGDIRVAMAGDAQLHEVDEPLIVKFSQQVSRVQPNISPEIAGEWRYHNRGFGIGQVEFVPKEAFDADTTYVVSFSEVERVLFGIGTVDRVELHTKKAPSIASTSLDNYQNNSQPIAMDQVLEVTLESQARSLRDLKMTLSPEVELTRTTTDQKTFRWEYDGLLQSDTEYTITISDMVQKEELKRLTIKTTPAPALKIPVKERNVAPQDALKMTFEEAVDPKNRPDIVFSLAGSGVWTSESEYTFMPSEKITPGKTYTYTLPKGLRTVRGGVMLESVEKSFQTNGKVTVIGTSPRGYELHQGSQQVKITFDQAVNHKSAEDRLTVSSGTIGNISWQGNTLIARVSNLGFQRTVTVSLGAGVQPDFGLPSSDEVSYSFTTEARTVNLNVPYYRQVYAQSCEAASLRMALAYRGIQDSDWNILQKFGYNPRPRDQVNNIWDDPNKQFVGDVNGSQRDGTGWGVFAGPVSRAAGNYGRSTAVAYGADANFTASQIHAGNPVIVWGIWGGSAKIDTWKTAAGSEISGPIPMHVRLVVGVKGEPDNPIGFYINDPISGQFYWTRAQFVANTAAAGPAAQLLAIQ